MIFPHEFSDITSVFITKKDENHCGKLLSFNKLKKNDELRSTLNQNKRILNCYLNQTGVELAMGLQVHGSTVTSIETPGFFPDTDGLVTSVKNLAIGVLVADCAAIYYFDPGKKIIGVAHAGWRGTVKQIPEKIIYQMQKEGANPSNIHAAISPCISKDYFETGEEVACLFPETFINRSKTKPHIDLKAYIIYQLQNAGIPKNQIHASRQCTYRDKDFYHSYRRDNTNSGRMLAAIVMHA